MAAVKTTLIKVCINLGELIDEAVEAEAKSHGVNPSDLDIEIHVPAETLMSYMFIEDEEKQEDVKEEKQEDVKADKPQPKRCRGKDRHDTWLAKYIANKNLNQTQVSEITGVSQSSISRMVCGYNAHEIILSKMIIGLKMSPEEAVAFRRSLKKDRRIREKLCNQ